jgi:hypothetical protein
VLGSLLRESGGVNIQCKPHVLDYSIGTALHDSQYQNYMVWPSLLKSVVIDTLSIAEEAFDQTYNLMLEEMQSSSFRGLWSLLTVWGERR